MKNHFIRTVIILLLGNIIFLNAEEIGFQEKITLKYKDDKHYPLINFSYREPVSLKVALVLSGGGGRGLAHLGVLKALEEHKIPIHLIVGSSIGSAIGGFYAAGYNPEQLIRIFKEIDWADVYNDETNRINLFWSQKSTPRRHILELRLDNGIPYIPTSLSPGQKIFDIIYSRLIKANFQAANDFDNLRIPFRAVATDLISGKRIVLKSGDLAEAISGSMAFPLLFAPVEMNGMMLVDGGIKDNLPVDVAVNQGAHITLAVDVTSSLRKQNQINSPWQIADQVTTIMMQEPTQRSREMADILILPQVGDRGVTDFKHIDSLVDLGYKATLSKIDSIQQLLENRIQDLWGENKYLGKVSKVKFYGWYNNEIKYQIKSLNTKEGHSLYLYDLYKDLLYIFQLGVFKDSYAILKGKPHAYQVEFHLIENPVIRNVNILDNHVLPDSLLRRKTRSLENKILNYRKLFSCVDSILTLYNQAGFSLARVLEINYDESSNLLDIRIDEGFINSIEIHGNKITRNNIIKRELRLKKGEIFKANYAIQSVRNIYSTNLFDRVTLNVIKSDSGHVVVIKVKEKKFFIVRLGANASLERKAKAFIELADDNLFGREIKTSMFGKIGNLERSAEFSLFSVRLFNTLLTYRLSLYYKDRWDRYYEDFNQTGDYLSIRRGTRFILGQQIARLGSITAEIRWDRMSIHDTDQFPYGGTYNIRTLTIRSVVDKRDVLPFPNQGIYNRWFWESGNQRLLYSSIAFTRFYIALEGFYPISKLLTYRIKGAAGSADQSLPFSEFFTLGGMDEFPGLFEREKFGRQMMLFINEFRYKFRWYIPTDMYLGVNFNIGAVWETSGEPVKKEDFLTSVGIYLALNSIFGPIQLTYGNLFNKRQILYVSMGYHF